MPSLMIRVSWFKYAKIILNSELCQTMSNNSGQPHQIFVKVRNMESVSRRPKGGHLSNALSKSGYQAQRGSLIH